MRKTVTAIIVCGIVGLAGVGRAATVYTDEATFLAAAGAVTTETFEDEAVVGTPDGGDGVAALSFGDWSATSSPAALKILDQAHVGNHNTTPGGEKYLAIDTDTGGISASASFADGSICALGFYVTDLDGTEGSFARVTIGGDSYDIPATGDGGEAYFGIITDSPFTSFDIGIPVGFDSAYSLDDISYGCSIVPEPSTLVLLSLGAVGAFRAWRRRRV